MPWLLLEGSVWGFGASVLQQVKWTRKTGSNCCVQAREGDKNYIGECSSSSTDCSAGLLVDWFAEELVEVVLDLGAEARVDWSRRSLEVVEL